MVWILCIFSSWKLQERKQHYGTPFSEFIEQQDSLLLIFKNAVFGRVQHMWAKPLCLRLRLHRWIEIAFMSILQESSGCGGHYRSIQHLSGIRLVLLRLDAICHSDVKPRVICQCLTKHFLILHVTLEGPNVLPYWLPDFDYRCVHRAKIGFILDEPLKSSVTYWLRPFSWLFQSNKVWSAYIYVYMRLKTWSLSRLWNNRDYMLNHYTCWCLVVCFAIHAMF